MAVHTGKTGNAADPRSHAKTAVAKADRNASDSNAAATQGQQDDKAQQEAAARDDSKTVAREKDTSRTAALRK